MIVRKLIACVFLLSGILLTGCNLSQSGAAVEVALNPSTLEIRPTRTPIPEINPTRTQIAAPTITVLGGNNSVAQPAAQGLEVGVIPTQPPPPNICSLRPNGTYDVNVRAGSSTDAAIQMVLKAGQYLQVVGRSANGWLKVSSGASGYGWVAAKVVTLNGPCDSLPIEAALALSAASSDLQTAASLTPTPTGMFGFTMNIPLNRLITKMDVGSIPAGTTVMVTSTQFNGSEYLYSITTADGHYETARDSQLAYSASGGTIPFPTPTQVVNISTTTGSAPNVPTPTPTPQVMSLPTDVSPSDVVIPNDLCTVTANTTTNLYAQPGSSTVVGILNPGPWSQVDASNGQGWYKVTIWTNGSQGWTTTSTVTLHGPCDKLPVE